MNIPVEGQVTSPIPVQALFEGKSRLLLRSSALMSAALVFSDLFSLILSGFLAVQIRYYLGTTDFLGIMVPSHYARFAAVAWLFIAIYSIRGLYPSVGLGAVEEFRRLVINTSIGFLAIATFSFAIQAPPVYSRISFVLTWGFALLFVPVARSLTRAFCARIGIWGEPVVVVGDPAQAAELVTLLRRDPKIGLMPVKICDNCTLSGGVGCHTHAQNREGINQRNQHEDRQRCPARNVGTVLAVYDDYNQIGKLREKYLDPFERVILVNHRDSGLDLSSVSVREFGGWAGLEIRQNLHDRWAQAEKRLIDIIVSAVGLVMLAPFFLITAALIYIDSPGRIFYRQMRVGKGGRHFKLLKFRTMQLNADKVLKETLAKDPELKREWDQYQKLKKDPRITRVGNLLRRFSIDEIPQLWNVFIGDMSLVGPRPMMINQIEMYGKPFEHYVRVVPGITGLWQVSGRNKTTFARRAELDVKYVMNWSIWLDIHILVRTVWVVMVRDGAA